ncbi:MAG: AMP-dependent synthetase/ligase, partial [Longimicrobiales bacterium]
RIVVFEESAKSPGVMSWSELLEAGAGESLEAFRARALEAQPHDTATLIYTSGTTGNPKGVMLTHNNLSSNVWASSQVLPVDASDASLSFLPLSHVFQRMVDYLFFSGGCVITHCSIDAVSDEMKRIRPTKVVSVPRLYEKVYQKVTTGDGLKGKLARWAAGVGREWLGFVERGHTPPLAVRAKYWVADRLVFTKIRDGLGGRLRYFVSGGAPLAADINRFFYAAGVKILEGYGLTETSPVINVSAEEDLRIGTVGRPVPGTEVRIADDGEILVRGPQVMKGYYGLDEKTKEVLDEDGWFSTGDIGELSSDGFLKITDRKKDLFKTSGGKYIAPQPIENRLKKIPFVDQAVVVGEGRNFCTVLIVPALDQLRSWAEGEGLEAAGSDALQDERVQEAMAKRVLSELSDLARYETPKKIGLLLQPFTIEDGTLTPTQKVKRKVVLDRHAELIESFYDAANRERTVFLSDAPAAS